MTYGSFDALALSVNYNFSLDEMRHATFAGSQTTETMKTGFHETTHLYQVLTTSYGYYTQLLLDFQVNQILLMVTLLREQFGLAPKLPLSRQVLGLPRGSSALIRTALWSWYLAEVLRVYFEGTPDRYSSYVQSHAELFGTSTLTRFAIVNQWLTGYLNEIGRAVLPDPEPTITIAKTEEELFEREQVELGSKFFLDVDVSGVLESAARVAENWGQVGPVPAWLTDRNVGISVAQIPYLHFIRLAANHIRTDDVGAFSLTYGVLADVALNPPILPHHAQLRSADTVISDLNPMSRMLTAIEHVSRIAPITSLADDYERFVIELCEICRWPTPDQIAAGVQHGAPSEPLDRFTELYLRSVEYKAELPFVFHDLSVWYLPETPLSAAVKYYFSHPIMQFTDTVRLHNDQDSVQFFVSNYMLRDYLRHILLSQDPTVRLPYAADSQEVEVWSEILSELLASVGFVNPRMNVQPGSIASRHTN